MTTHPHPIDIHVGARVRQARKAAGLTLMTLAANLGVTHQQLNKNEHGTNRIGCSRLYQIAAALKKEISWFFEGAKS